jgi:hypothetical protein
VLPSGDLFGAIYDGGVCVHKRRDDYARVLRVAAPIPFEAYWEAIRTQDGAEYDLWGAIGLPFRQDWQDSDRWFCSELHAWAAEVAGYPLLSVDSASRITPRDLLLSPLLRPA